MIHNVNLNTTFVHVEQECRVSIKQEIMNLNTTFVHVEPFFVIAMN